MFRLVLGLTNTSASTPSRNLMISFYCDAALYKLAQPLLQVPLLVPGLRQQPRHTSPQYKEN